jgi:hypothetical protein
MMGGECSTQGAIKTAYKVEGVDRSISWNHNLKSVD